MSEKGEKEERKKERKKHHRANEEGKESRSISTANQKRSSSSSRRRDSCSSSSTVYKRYPDCADASSKGQGGRASSVNLFERSKKENFEDLLSKMSRSSPRSLAEEQEGRGVLDYSPKGGGGEQRKVLESRKLSEVGTYRPYLDGKLCENAKPFDNVSFCFTCDRDNLEPKEILPMVRMTGMKGDGDIMIPIYKQLFMCPLCREEYRDKGIVRVLSRALETYFKE